MSVDAGADRTRIALLFAELDVDADDVQRACAGRRRHNALVSLGVLAGLLYTWNFVTLVRGLH